MQQAALSKLGSYRGRFAPSPSGPLHFGSLVAALASYLAAKTVNGQWLVRIEDIDTPRVVKNADTHILTALEHFGLHWDGEVVYQSQRHDLYQQVLSTLTADLYACDCTRKQIKAAGGLYQGHCRELNHPLNLGALRLKQHYPTAQFNDLIQGVVNVPNALAEEDYIVKRRDGLYAYQLVVVVDDIEQGITDVVRGADLLEPTARQISLFKQLNAAIPNYAHVPLAVKEPGFKLSKQNHAPAIDISNPQPQLMQAMQFLGLTPPLELEHETVDSILSWAITHFSLADIPANIEQVIAV